MYKYTKTAQVHLLTLTIWVLMKNKNNDNSFMNKNTSKKHHNERKGVLPINLLNRSWSITLSYTVSSFDLSVTGLENFMQHDSIWHLENENRSFLAIFISIFFNEIVSVWIFFCPSVCFKYIIYQPYIKWSHSYC